MTHPFLSDDWISAARGIREKYADQIPEITSLIRINQVITEVPFGDGEVHTHLDTSSGHLSMEAGLLDEADATITTDYATARALFVDGDQATAMQAFMSGKIKVQGDMMKMMALQTVTPESDVTRQVAQEIRDITG